MLDWPQDKSATGCIAGPDGDLEVSVDLPGDTPRGVVVICHPHPQHGGTKDNKVVFMLARAATTAGFAAVRFNFRGVGASQGTYDAGVGEVDDAQAVRDWALEASGLALAALAGFSFGAAAALRLAERQAPPRLVTVGLPAGYFEDGMPRPDSSWLAIYGSADDVIDVDASIAAVGALEPPVDVEILEEAGHFLHGRLTELRRPVIAYLKDEVD